jgi:hypothetical protein
MILWIYWEEKFSKYVRVFGVDCGPPYSVIRAPYSSSREVLATFDEVKRMMSETKPFVYYFEKISKLVHYNAIELKERKYSGFGTTARFVYFTDERP